MANKAEFWIVLDNNGDPVYSEGGLVVIIKGRTAARKAKLRFLGAVKIKKCSIKIK